MRILRSIQWRMYLTALIGCLLIGGFVVFLSMSYWQTEQRSNLERRYIEKADNIAEQIDLTLSDLTAVAVQLQSNSELQRMFVSAGSSRYANKNYFLDHLEERKNAQGIIWMFVAARSEIVGIHIFNDSSYVGMRETPSNARIRELAEQEMFDIPEGELSKIIGLHKDEWDMLQQREVFSVLRIFEATDYNFNPVGMIEVQARYSLLEEICAADKGMSEKIVIATSEGEIIYPTDGIENIETLVSLSESDTLQSAVFMGVDSLVAKKVIPNTGWAVYVTEDAKNLEPSLSESLPVTFLAALPFFLLLILCVAMALRQVIKPILHLTNEVAELSPEHLRPEFSPTQIRELDTLQKAFTRLLDAREDVNQKLLLSQQTELNLRIEALQAQINPHYLFNSLSAISAVGTEENSERIPMMCYQLGELFRYVSMDETKQTTLADEMEHISRYIDFMKWRYEANLHSEIILEGELDQISVAKLSIHPLVENCFTHGFKESFAPYSLRIDCRCSERGWHFIIADNGCGFSQEQIDELSRDIYLVDNVLRTHQGYENLRSQNKAILNLYIRLKLQYGEKLWFEVLRDMELGGALVKIVVEYDRKET